MKRLLLRPAGSDLPSRPAAFCAGETARFHTRLATEATGRSPGEVEETAVGAWGEWDTMGYIFLINNNEDTHTHNDVYAYGLKTEPAFCMFLSWGRGGVGWGGVG